MKNQPGTYSRRWFNPKTILFGISVFNFVLLWNAAHRMGGAACVACPWYYPWSYLNEPTLLLLAAISILISRKWSYIVALGLSGYLIGDLVARSWFYDFSLIESVIHFSPYDEVVYAWQIQYLLALISFTLATLYLAQSYLPRFIHNSNDKDIEVDDAD